MPTIKFAMIGDEAEGLRKLYVSFWTNTPETAIIIMEQKTEAEMVPAGGRFPLHGGVMLLPRRTHYDVYAHLRQSIWDMLWAM